MPFIEYISKVPLIFGFQLLSITVVFYGESTNIKNKLYLPSIFTLPSSTVNADVTALPCYIF